MVGYIYKTTNTVNNKIYVGQRKSDVFLNEKYLGSGKVLLQAVEKYGKECFTVELIDTAETLEELGEKERYWIKTLQSQNPDIGYNISPGGVHVPIEGKQNGFFGKHHSEETKQLLRDKAALRPAMSQETRDKIAEKNRGSHRSEETRKKMGNLQRGRKAYTDGVIVKYFFPDRDTIPDGFYPGCPQSTKEKLSAAGKGRAVSEDTRAKLTQRNYERWSNYSEEERTAVCNNMRLAAKAEGHINGGGDYWRGKKRGPLSEEHKHAMAKTLKDKRWVTNGTVSKMVHFSEVDEYLQKGYWRGRK